MQTMIIKSSRDIFSGRARVSIIQLSCGMKNENDPHSFAEIFCSFWKLLICTRRQLTEIIIMVIRTSMLMRNEIATVVVLLIGE